MRTELFDYPLPEQAIAQHPPAERDGGRLLVLGRAGVAHRRIRDLAELVPAGALLVVNDSRVIKARILGRRSSGGRVELLLLRRQGDSGSHERWLALGRASKPLRPGTRVQAGPLGIEVIAQRAGGSLELEVSAEGGVEPTLDRVGHVPLPPYVQRDDRPEDVTRYQTVYAREPGSVAAPTAGLHLSQALLGELETRGIEVASTTLHVGLGTFRPVSVADLDDHPMHAELFQVGADLARRVERARARGAAVVAVGTTVVRALESAADPQRPGRVRACSGETELLIQPGHRFRVVDALLTNFHMPKSTLLALVSAFAGRERVLDAYRGALAAGYRFLSYGDAMFIPERAR